MSDVVPNADVGPNADVAPNANKSSQLPMSDVAPNADSTTDQAYYPDHEEFGQWDMIFEELIFPKITDIFTLLACLSMNKTMCNEAGKKINANTHVDWSKLEEFCCRKHSTCGARHTALDEMMLCGNCNYSVPARFDALMRGMNFLVRTHGGMKKEVIYDSWGEKRYFM